MEEGWKDGWRRVKGVMKKGQWRDGGGLKDGRGME